MINKNKMFLNKYKLLSKYYYKANLSKFELFLMKYIIFFLL